MSGYIYNISFGYLDHQLITFYTLKHLMARRHKGISQELIRN